MLLSMYKMLFKLYNQFKYEGIMGKLQRNSDYYYYDARVFSRPFDQVHYFVQENYEIGMHQQEFFEINIITRGRGVHYIEESSVSAEVGDVFIIPPDIEHGYEGGDGFDVYHVLISNKFMRKNISDLQSLPGFALLFDVEPMMRARAGVPLHLKLDEEQFSRISKILDYRSDKERIGQPDEAMINAGALFILIAELCKIYKEGSREENITRERKDAAFMRSLSVIHERFAEKLSIDELASVARLSRSTFIRQFIHICKMTPARYILKKRVEAAENMLLNSSASLFEIAESVGFYDAAHFSRTFKKINGQSPIEYRRRRSVRDQAENLHR